MHPCFLILVYLILSVVHAHPGSKTHGNSADVYQQVLGPGDTLCPRQTQSDGDEAQH